MIAWRLLLGGFVTWTVHFFASYIVSITLVAQLGGKVLVGAITLACLCANLLLFLRALKDERSEDDFQRWTAGGGMFVLLLSTIAILWQGLPALIS